MATERTAQLSDYGLLLRRQWWVVAATTLLALGAAILYTVAAPAQYTSTTSVLVTPTGLPSDSASTTRGNSVINMDTEAQIITSTAVVLEAADALDHPGDPRDLAEHLTVTVPPNTEILDIHFTGGTATEAARGAEAFAAAYLANRGEGAEEIVRAEVETLDARIQDLNEQLSTVTEAIASAEAGSAAREYNEAQAAGLNDQLSDLNADRNALDAITLSPGRVITQASVPSAPSSPNPVLNLAAGTLLGLMAGVGLAVLRQRADTVLRSASDVGPQTGLAVLAEMPVPMDPEQVRIVSPAGPEGRGYTRLRNVVTSGDASARVILVAGVAGAAGPVAANLAASLARAGEETVLVCADVHAGTEAGLLGTGGGAGLGDVLAGRTAVSDARVRLPGLRELSVLGPGSDPDLTAELLQTAGPRTVLADLLETAAWVVIEVAVSNTGADAQTLAGASDVAVLVVQTDSTRAQDVREARAQFESMRTRVLGAVVVPAPPRATRDRSRPDSAVEQHNRQQERPVGTKAAAGADG